METDSTEFSSMSEDFSSTQTFRDRTLAFVRVSLGFEDPAAQNSFENDTVITCFDVIGKEVLDAYNPTQIGRLLEQIEVFLDMQALEHRVSLSDKLPTVEQYRHRRMGTSAILLRHATARGCDEEQANERVVGLVNDILSVHKEILIFHSPQAHDQVDSLIPLAFIHTHSAQSATDMSIDIVKNAVEGFEAAASALVASTAGQDDSTRAKTLNFIDGLKSKRYGLDQQAENGALDVTI
ncbi:MAG: hypothetical protein Q9184_005875 [Pyrenodesmia sp. 2 TL-2023]